MKKKSLRFLIAYGPTQEPLDPVRFLSNRSTGTMGRYLVQAARRRGHRVSEVECPKKTDTALRLEKTLKKLLPGHDVLVMAAAVCDVRPRVKSRAKIKKDRLNSIPLVKNPDILERLGKIKKSRQVFVGFGLESENLLGNGRKKLEKKKLDLILLQKVTTTEIPFGDRLVNALLLRKDGTYKELKRLRKQRIAGLLVREAEALVSA